MDRRVTDTGFDSVNNATFNTSNDNTTNNNIGTTTSNNNDNNDNNDHDEALQSAKQKQQTSKAEKCVGCMKPITERYLLKVMNQSWHEDCLKCSCCNCRLGEVGSTLFTRANLMLCKRDYLRLFGATGFCSACAKPIPAFEMVMKAKDNVYHLDCFSCYQCNHRFCVGDRYYLIDNKIFCEGDFEERFPFSRLTSNNPSTSSSSSSSSSSFPSSTMAGNNISTAKTKSAVHTYQQPHFNHQLPQQHFQHLQHSQQHYQHHHYLQQQTSSTPAPRLEVGQSDLSGRS